jgi:hypothetical protein
MNSGLPSAPQTVMLYVQFSKTEDASATDTGIAIIYHSAGTAFTYIVPWAAVVCGKGDTHPECARGK